MASNDDSGGPDSYLRFNVPEDGEYGISVTDQLHQGGPDYVYRVEITDVKLDLVFAIPQFPRTRRNAGRSRCRAAIAMQRWFVPPASTPAATPRLPIPIFPKASPCNRWMAADRKSFACSRPVPMRRSPASSAVLAAS